MDFQEQDRLFKVRTTVLEMIEDRSIRIPVIDKNLTAEQFTVQYQANNIDIYIHDEETDKKVYVHFYNSDKSFGKKSMSDLMINITEKYQDDNILVILILKDKENNMVTKELQKPAYKNVEVFLQQSLVFNITKHELVPEHRILTEEEEKSIGFNKKELPIILKSDPVAKYYGMKPGQVCKIKRISLISGFTYYYRVVK